LNPETDSPESRPEPLKTLTRSSIDSSEALAADMIDASQDKIGSQHRLPKSLQHSKPFYFCEIIKETYSYASRRLTIN
jgi:hypothetical protein